MESGIHREQEMTRLMADDYAGKIMSVTYQRPMSIQQISQKCAIPIAVAYRRVGRMEELGLVRCEREEEAYRGKKVRFYMCAVDILQLTFNKGRFTVSSEPRSPAPMRSAEGIMTTS
jgi:predicted transcriptional regulator